MQLFVFYAVLDARVALSTDPNGDNLPGKTADWEFRREIGVHPQDPPLFGFSTKDILAAIEHKGHFAADVR